MEYRQLGSSGVRVSVIGLGTNRFGSDALPQKEVNSVMDIALELGINHIDTANSYQGGRSEEVLGTALKGRWDRFVVASKFFFPVGDGPNDRGASRYHLMNMVENSLKRLQSDHIDLYYIHRWDESTPITETMRTLDDLVSAGKVRYVGVSAFASWQLAKTNLLAELNGWEAAVAIQSHYHMLERDVEREVIPYCQAHNVALIPYFPLAGGFLAGKYKRDQPAPAGSRGESSSYVQAYMTATNYDKIEKLTSWAEAQGRGMNELARAWLMAQPQVCSVITGATRLDHVRSNVMAADWLLTLEELGEVDAILSPAAGK